MSNANNAAGSCGVPPSNIVFSAANAISGITGANTAMLNQNIYSSTFQSSGYGIGSPPKTSIVSFYNGNKEIVKIALDGTVVWTNGEVDIDAAADALCKGLALGVELAAGITEGVKCRIRDSVFRDIIAVAKEKGSLTAEELTYLLQASKIMENLKGIK